MAKSLETDAGTFAIACFSDSGLHAVCEAVKQSALGIAECCVLTALTMGQSFGVIATLKGSIPLHKRFWGAMGVSARLVGEISTKTRISD